MDFKLLNEKYNRCCTLITTQRLRDAFILVQELASESRNTDFLNQLEGYRETYRNILKYSFGEIEDPQKKEVYYRLLKSILELADQIRESILDNEQLSQVYRLRRKKEIMADVRFEEIDPLVESLNWEEYSNKLELEQNDDAIIARGLIREERIQKITKLFHTFWLKDKYKEDEIVLAKKLLNSGLLPWYDKSLLVSAISLSLFRSFDEAKFHLLINAYKTKENQVWQRALVSLVMALYQYNKRISYYPGLAKELSGLSEIPDFEKHLEAVLIQFIRTRDTEKIARKFRDEIMPEMAKIQSRIYEKLDLPNIIKDPFSEEKNPDWEHVFHDTPNLYNKLEEFSMLQMEGSDVFMSTFAMLKQFDFFTQIPHWFLPFYKENPQVKASLGDKDGAFDPLVFAEGMEKSYILCNSDKYSFCLNVMRMPLVQRSMMVEMFNMELRAMEELAQDDEMLKKPSAENAVFKQYIQDLYRFFKLYPNRQEHYDIFSTRCDFHNTGFFSLLLKDVNIQRNIGEFYFEKGHYKDAIELFSLLDLTHPDPELWQKIAYSYQQLGDFSNALEYYLKADLADTGKSWTLKKIALCYRKLGNHRKALEYYQEAEKMEPENLHVQANLGHSYFDLKEWEPALNYYFKVEFLSEEKSKVQRPIAWCSLMLGKLETAKKYFEKIGESDLNQHDLLNLGHIEWCQGNKKAAISRYLQCIKKSEDFSWFASELLEDSDLLTSHGIDTLDIPLMRDYLKLMQEQNF